MTKVCESLGTKKARIAFIPKKVKTLLPHTVQPYFSMFLWLFSTGIPFRCNWLLPSLTLYLCKIHATRSCTQKVAFFKKRHLLKRVKPLGHQGMVSLGTYLTQMYCSYTHPPKTIRIKKHWPIYQWPSDKVAKRQKGGREGRRREGKERGKERERNERRGKEKRETILHTL